MRAEQRYPPLGQGGDLDAHTNYLVGELEHGSMELRVRLVLIVRSATSVGTLGGQGQRVRAGATAWLSQLFS